MGKQAETRKEEEWLSRVRAGNGCEWQCREGRRIGCRRCPKSAMFMR